MEPFTTWKKISVSADKNADQYLSAMRELGISGNDNAVLMIKGLDYTNVSRDVELVLISHDELRSRLGHDIFNTTSPVALGLELGLALCPQSAGPELRLQFTDQEPDTMYFMAMEEMDPAQETANGLAKCSFVLSSSSEGQLGLMGLSLDWYGRESIESYFIFAKQ